MEREGCMGWAIIRRYSMTSYHSVVSLEYEIVDDECRKTDTGTENLDA
jgi:hypothetical protein